MLHVSWTHIAAGLAVMMLAIGLLFGGLRFAQSGGNRTLANPLAIVLLIGGLAVALCVPAFIIRL